MPFRLFLRGVYFVPGHVVGAIPRCRFWVGFAVPYVVDRANFDEEMVLHFLQARRVLERRGPALRGQDAKVHAKEGVGGAKYLPVVPPAAINQGRVDLMVELERCELILVRPGVRVPLLVKEYRFWPILPYLEGGDFAAPASFRVVSDEVCYAAGGDPLEFKGGGINEITIVNYPTDDVIDYLAYEVERASTGYRLYQ